MIYQKEGFAQWTISEEEVKELGLKEKTKRWSEKSPTYVGQLNEYVWCYDTSQYYLKNEKTEKAIRLHKLKYLK